MRIFTLAGSLLVSFSACLPVGTAFAQEEQTDTTKVLNEVVVKAYRSDRPLKDVPVTVNVLDSKDLNRFGPMSMVTSVNTVPGVRMEERSPGSYRFSIRGSVLRSPFGIRNVKFYWKGLPFTDGGGNTYLNLFDLSTIGNMEIIKGPGASLYGAGTGGVVLLDSNTGANQMGQASIQFGSYGLFRWNGTTVMKEKRYTIELGISHQKNNGYRQQTALDRTNVRINYDQLIAQKGKLSMTFVSGALNYETPGGLNKTQYEADPRQARPATPTIPGAVDQRAAITNSTEYFGTVYQHDWNEHWSTNVGIYGSGTRFKNPAILNYEQREEWNGGGRTETQYSFKMNERKGKITFGAEYQALTSPVKVYDNNGGDKGNLRTDDLLTSNSFFTFAQAELELPYQFTITAGGSLNFLKYQFERKSTDPNVEHTRNFKPGAFPRFAVIKKFNEQFSIYSSVSEGFSAPTLAEVLPSTSIFNSTLNPEKGTSIEAGIRTELFNRQVRFNVAAYNFRLRETIVIRTDNNGADYFINAGTTSQKGIESTVAWTPTWGTKKLGMFRLWMSYTFNDYHFLNYISGTKDFSGNMLTGVPPVVVVGGLDLMLKKGWYLNTVLNYTDHIAVNDANTEFAHDYKVLSARIGKRQDIWKFNGIEFFGGIDNALNQKYSLGNDLNAAGGRYYNAAPARNFYIGLMVPIMAVR
jgi:iron complex outermembrane receptor protein